MNSTLLMVIIISILIAFIIFISCIILKNLFTPKKIGNIQKLIKSGKIQAAEKTAKSVLTKNPKDYVAHYWLGEAYLADNKEELAFMEFKTVNENAVFNGDIPELKFRKKMSALYLKFNYTEDALKEYLLLTKLEPANSENFYNAGKLYESINQPTAAYVAYEKSITLDKRNSKAHAAFGYLLFRNKKIAEAKKEIDTAIKLSPETFANYYYLGKILKESKDYSGAVKAFEKSQRDPEMRQRSLIERGSCYMIADQIDNAIGEFDHAIKCSKNDSNQETIYARYFLAACYEKTHQIEKAIEQWEAISKRNKSFRDVPAKLNEYKDVQTNDAMKEYLTTAPQQFMEVAKKAAKAGYNLACQKVEQTNFGCIMLATEDSKDNWKNMRQQIFLVEFFRNSEPLSETAVRKAADLVKAKGYYKAILFSSSGFTGDALNFAENRPLILAGKEIVEHILNKAGV
ncbi:MAG: tetratricopeptide repeat protein [Treponema sp.]|nr:tetratricopeptide repeat protein [Treponema sp.]